MFKIERIYYIVPLYANLGILAGISILDFLIKQFNIHTALYVIMLISCFSLMTKVDEQDIQLEEVQ